MVQPRTECREAICVLWLCQRRLPSCFSSVFDAFEEGGAAVCDPPYKPFRNTKGEITPQNPLLLNALSLVRKRTPPTAGEKSF